MEIPRTLIDHEMLEKDSYLQTFSDSEVFVIHLLHHHTFLKMCSGQRLNRFILFKVMIYKHDIYDRNDFFFTIIHISKYSNISSFIYKAPSLYPFFGVSKEGEF